MFGKMKKMLKDEEGTGILGGVGGTIMGCLSLAVPGTICRVVSGPLNMICPPIPIICGPALLGGAAGGLLGGVAGTAVDYVMACCTMANTVALSCFGSVASCINFVSSLMGGMLGGK